uniref:Crumbs cell polarity complex component 1 n=1 Tax=Paramormyrops kingsleyae TaxID=1676925 RepID=A0A3B3T555_9TELE|nr:protein crumbs homolog 1 [Paramormyrops kingsleyae]
MSIYLKITADTKIHGWDGYKEAAGPSRFKAKGWVLLFLAISASTASESSQKVLSACLSNPCQNGALCQEAPVNFLCWCASDVPPRSGTRCEESEGPCRPVSCQEKVSCTPPPTGSGELVCQCHLGYCEPQVQLCARRLCGGDVQCHRSPRLREEPNYTCKCKGGYAGAHCEGRVNHCVPNPCRNRAICRSKGDAYACYCVPGFQGKHCEIEVNECASQPCQNGATCTDRIGRYACLCKPGYTGSNCELQTDECQSRPCLNGGSCHGYLRGFSCLCPAGFQGDFCEINIDECRSQPCQNGALCVDGVNGYSCEAPIMPCTSQPCLNNGLCQEKHGNYTCNCWPGYQGSHCEVDVSECSSSPCLSAGVCHELSWEVMYGREPLLPGRFRPQQAAGFVCKCKPGLKGTFCEEDINECDQDPCKNGGICVNNHGGYTCQCLQQSQDGLLYGGLNCTEALIGCEDHGCLSGGTCFPFFSEDRHGHVCICPSGFSGSECQKSTTFSFEGSGYLHLVSPTSDSESFFNMTLSFRTVLANAVLFQWEDGEFLIRLKLENGHLHLELQRNGSLNGVLELPHHMADLEWHSVEVTLGGETLKMRTLDGMCHQHCGEEVYIQSRQLGRSSAFQRTFIGGLGVEETSSGPAEATPPHFIGCLRDVRLNSQLLLPDTRDGDVAVNVSPGCRDRHMCKDDPCEARGRCINLWQNRQCECYRPYVGQNCSEENIPARFGNDNWPSYAVFTVDDNPGPNNVISMFIGTTKHAGLLLVIANSTNQYLRIWLDGGFVQVQANDFEMLHGEQFVSDGNFHLVTVETEEDRMSLFQSGQKHGITTTIQTLQIRPKDKVHLGGLVDQPASSLFGGYFKGCIQDLRVNSKHLQFYPVGTPISSYTLDTIVNVTRGCTSDNICNKKPCHNGGMCHPLWDDFSCTCPPNATGRSCERVRWCQLAPCPPTAVCQPSGEGFDCISNATFQDGSSLMVYRTNGKIIRNLTNVSFSIRTRKYNVTILHAVKEPDIFTVFVQDSFLFLELRSGNSSFTLSLKSQRVISDGEWHSVELSMVTPSSPTSQWSMVIDKGSHSTISGDSAGNLDFLKDRADVLLGGSVPDAAGNLVGCLSTVEIGGIVLPYYGDSELNHPRFQEEQFIKTTTEPVSSGCTGKSVCEATPCVNGGICEDLFNLSACTCSPGWTGKHCEVNTDWCLSSPCVHGNCSTLTLGYECVCEAGYTGVNCEGELDFCEGNKCAHGATCLHRVQKYSCLCPDGYYGPYCTEPVEEIPWHIVQNHRPRLPVSICGNKLKNYTCYNGGNCSETGMMCDCLAGFVGDRCEVEINECASHPCVNGGFCLNMINKFYCNCPINFAGETCQIDLNGDGLTSQLLLSACLVLVALLLAIFLTFAALAVVVKRRASHGAYSPSRQEKEGSRVEMWNMVQPPPMERLI